MKFLQMKNLNNFKKLMYFTIEFQLISEKSYFHDDVYKTCIQLLARLKEFSEINTVFGETDSGYTANMIKNMQIDVQISELTSDHMILLRHLNSDKIFNKLRVVYRFCFPKFNDPSVFLSDFLQEKVIDKIPKGIFILISLEKLYIKMMH
mmetsp:Transcript_4424/g.3708  ORF Transcript_4424/g.3708 Transcript_4424/m.3708 type:complete len:150 (+) Transcript_4424:35-484(+)